MSVRAVDPARSRVVLVGTSSYDGDEPLLPNVPVVANNVADLAAVLTDPQFGGFDPAHCMVAPPGAEVAHIGDLLVQAAAEAEDLLLFYYSGHGLLGPRRRELYLTLSGTRPDRLAFTALAFDAVRDACLDSRATSRVVILDSCFSGRAIGETLADDDETVLGQIQVAGTYTLTSAAANRTALILPGEQHTAFTERMLALLRTGSPRAGEMISLGDIYRHLHAQLWAEGLPVPQQRGTETADLLGLVRNRRFVPLAHAAAATLEPMLPPQPQSPTDTESLTGTESQYAHLRAPGAPEIPAWTLSGHTDGVMAVAFSPDGTLVATGSADCTVRLWDSRSRQPIGEPLTGRGLPFAMAFSPDGTLLATGSDEGMVQLWDPRTRRLIGGITAGHTDTVRAVAFSPDSTLLATGSDDCTVWLWDPRTRQPVGGPLTSHTGRVYAVAWSRPLEWCSG